MGIELIRRIIMNNASLNDVVTIMIGFLLFLVIIIDIIEKYKIKKTFKKALEISVWITSTMALLLLALYGILNNFGVI